MLPKWILRNSTCNNHKLIRLSEKWGAIIPLAYLMTAKIYLIIHIIKAVNLPLRNPLDSRPFCKPVSVSQSESYWQIYQPIKFNLTMLRFEHGNEEGYGSCICLHTQQGWTDRRYDMHYVPFNNNNTSWIKRYLFIYSFTYFHHHHTIFI